MSSRIYSRKITSLIARWVPHTYILFFESYALAEAYAFGYNKTRTCFLVNLFFVPNILKCLQFNNFSVRNIRTIERMYHFESIIMHERCWMACLLFLAYSPWNETYYIKMYVLIQIKIIIIKAFQSIQSLWPYQTWIIFYRRTTKHQI